MIRAMAKAGDRLGLRAQGGLRLLRSLQPQMGARGVNSSGRGWARGVLIAPAADGRTGY